MTSKKKRKEKEGGIKSHPK